MPPTADHPVPHAPQTTALLLTALAAGALIGCGASAPAHKPAQPAAIPPAYAALPILRQPPPSAAPAPGHPSRHADPGEGFDVALGVSTASAELAEQALRTGALDTLAALRVEDFIARAMPLGVPRRDTDTRIVAHAAPDPLDPGRHLVLLRVIPAHHALDAASVEAPPVILVEPSRTLDPAPLRDALERWPGPPPRVLVATEGGPTPIDAPRQLTPRAGPPDWPAAFAAALDPDRRPRRVIVYADGRGGPVPPLAAVPEHAVIILGAGDIDPARLGALAALTGGHLERVDGPALASTLAWIRERPFPHLGARLAVRFPDGVPAWRLIGHLDAPTDPDAPAVPGGLVWDHTPPAVLFAVDAGGRRRVPIEVTVTTRAAGQPALTVQRALDVSLAADHPHLRAAIAAAALADRLRRGPAPDAATYDQLAALVDATGPTSRGGAFARALLAAARAEDHRTASPRAP